MKNDKGKIIYLISSVLMIVLLFFPGSLNIFKLPISELVNLKFDIFSFLPDIISIVILIISYIILRSFYKRKSIYIKFYPVFLMIVFITWTIIIRLR